MLLIKPILKSLIIFQPTYGLTLFFLSCLYFFALSFFGLYEIGLPYGFANKIDSRSGMNDFWGIFFMALTLAIVSFSCTGPIFGSLLAGALTNDGGASATFIWNGWFWFRPCLAICTICLFPGLVAITTKIGGMVNFSKSGIRIFGTGIGR